MTDHGLAPLQSEFVTRYETGLHIDWRISYDEWAAMFPSLESLHTLSQWWLGDWYNAGLDLFGEDCQQAFPENYSSETIRKYAWVCRQIPPVRRFPNVTFSHHIEVAPLPLDDQTECLKLARSPDNPHGLSVRGLREHIQDNGHKLAVGQGDTPRYCPTCGQVWEDDA